MLPESQLAMVQSPQGRRPLRLSTVAVPSQSNLPTGHHVIIRVVAVALNPNDHKMLRYFPAPNAAVGCDFCGIVVSVGAASVHQAGARVCGAVFPYHPGATNNGAFAQYLTADSRLLLKVPDGWSDLQGAALGGVGWATLSLAFSDPEALALQGTPSCPADAPAVPILVYGGGTATGALACQLLARSGYKPLAVASNKSARLAMLSGAVGVASYTSPVCVETIRSMAGEPIRHALDCITDAHSAAICFGAIHRAGGRYACLEKFPDSWRTRRAVEVKEVMGYETLNVDVFLGQTTYTRRANRNMFEIGKRWAGEMQLLLDAASIEPQAVREIPGQWDGIDEAFALLEDGQAGGEKLVVRLHID